MFRTGYVTNFRGDLLWFISLPFLAIIFALFTRHYLSAVAMASVSLWITYPHHYVTFLRTYGIVEDWRIWKDQLIIGPLVICALTFLGVKYAPLTLLLVFVLWDHQHSLMQQHGIARIYDFKARTGGPMTGRYDLAFNWIVYGNLIITSPLFSKFWIREIYRFGIPISADFVWWVQMISWALTLTFLVMYSMHIIRSVRQGYSVNPLKYAFLGSSYFLWYFVGWQTDSLLMHGIAHRIMHGVQYIVIAYLYMRRTTGDITDHNRFVTGLVKPGHVILFLFSCLMYAIIFALLIDEPLQDFGFGVALFTESYLPISEHNLAAMTPQIGYDLFATVLINVVAMTHYYLDSFIWKVRVKRVQQGI